MNWDPFHLAPTGQYGDPPRLLQSAEGIGDRLRSAAFAEIQARNAFLWAADRYTEAPAALRNAWKALAAEEEKHMNWLLGRLTELRIDVRERRVTDHLWQSFMGCTDAQAFSVYMASAEERGRKAGLRFHQALQSMDLITAEIFLQIAEEEKSHIELAGRFFPEAWERRPEFRA